MVALVAVVLALAANYLVFTLVRVESASMSPTVMAGEVAGVWKLGGITRGDVVAVDASGYLATAPGAPTTVIKRVVGVGGDRVTCCAGGVVWVNGAPQSEPYLAPGAVNDVAFDVVVPPDSLWVLGDNRAASLDSRSGLGRPGGGFIPEKEVTGKVVAILWPLAQARSVAGS